MTLYWALTAMGRLSNQIRPLGSTAVAAIASEGMKLRSTFCLALLALVAFALPAPAAAGVPTPLTRLTPDDFGEGAAAAFKVEGSNGYTIAFDAYAEGIDGRGAIFVSVSRKGEAAIYRWPAIVSDSFVRADLGSLGRVDLALRRSGREKSIPIKCSPHIYAYEPGVYEGIVEFKGERGYTRAGATQVPLLPLFDSFCSGSGSGESIGSGIPGARIRGVSYAHGRKLAFQINKNRPRTPAVYTAELTERHDGMVVYRTVEGVAPASAFRWGAGAADGAAEPAQPLLRHRPPAPRPRLDLAALDRRPRPRLSRPPGPPRRPRHPRHPRPRSLRLQ